MVARYRVRLRERELILERTMQSFTYLRPPSSRLLVISSYQRYPLGCSLGPMLSISCRRAS